MQTVDACGGDLDAVPQRYNWARYGDARALVTLDSRSYEFLNKGKGSIG